MENKNEMNLILNFEESDKRKNYLFDATIESELDEANSIKEDLVYKINENLSTIKELTSECDITDYALAASSGALCGIIDIFLVGTPDNSVLENVTDEWCKEKVKLFAKMCGWNNTDSSDPFKSAIKFLEKEFPVPYDQTGMGEAGLQYLDLTPSNHHFKSLSHNSSLLGLFFSILDQFGEGDNNLAHFVSGGDLAIWVVPNGDFELRGKTLITKFIAACWNWLGHLISDQAGSSSSKGRGAGIPSPLWTWTNDVIAIKKALNLNTSEFDKAVNELALNIYTEGYDSRFQEAQAIPVIINEVIVRMLYSLRRAIRYFSKNKIERSFDVLWNECEPFSNATVKRMLTVAHGTFCLIDLSDATVSGFVKGGGTFNVKEFVLRLNLIGVGRFSISLYGETKRNINKKEIEKETHFLKQEKTIIEDYIEGLVILSELYNDKELINFVDDLKDSDLYKQAFSKSALLAEKRNVPKDKILKNKSDIDEYFE